jgi:hypothetical protein
VAAGFIDQPLHFPKDDFTKTSALQRGETAIQ